MTAAQQRLAGEKARHRHVWMLYAGEDGSGHRCRSCMTWKDEAKSRRGRSSRSRGNRRELELAKALGGQKVGMYGGPADILTPLLAVQSKVRRGAAFPGWMDDELAKLPTTGGRAPALIVTDSPGPGIRRRSLVVLRLEDFQALHGRLVEEAPR